MNALWDSWVDGWMNGRMDGWMRGSERLRATEVRRLDMGGAMVGMNGTQLNEGHSWCVSGSGV